MKLKTIFIRLALVWFFTGQMICVCLPAHTTRALSKLESMYAFKPSASNKTALDNEFERTVQYETQRATWKFTTLLAADVVLIAFGWNWGSKRQRSRRRNDYAPDSMGGHVTAS